MITVPAFLSMFVLGCAVLLTLRLFYGPGETDRRDPIHLMLDLAGWTMIFLGALIGLIVVIGVLGFILWFLLPAIVIMVLAQRRATQRRILLSMLAIATQRDAPLEAALDAFSREQRGKPRRWARRLSARLASGHSLPEALAACPKCVPEFAEVYARVGHEVGALGPALREAAARQSWSRSLWQSMSGRVFYLVTFMIVASAVVAFALVGLGPAYHQIFNDYELELPPITSSVLDMSTLAAQGGWLAIASFAVGLIVLGILFFLFEIGVLRSLPGLDWLFRPAHVAVVLGNLALAADREQPMTTPLNALADVYPYRSIRRRLRRLAEAVERGDDWCEGLRAQRLIRRGDVAVLQSAERVGNLAWALRETADRGFRRAAYRIQAMVQIAFPCVILCFGVFVLWFVVGMFLPLVELIQDLT